MAQYFKPANILLPKNCNMEQWAVIACDQFTSDLSYWKRVKEKACGVPSTLHMILPEAELEDADPTRIESINAVMKQYLDEGIFTEYPNAYIYVERTLKNGMVRQGVVGMLDLEHYDYDPSVHPMISATENTVLERIPPRVAVRQNAPVELPHVLLLCEDEAESIIEEVANRKAEMKKLYDFDLMEGGGHIAGWLVADEVLDTLESALLAYEANNVYLVGDGNHSLVTAKTCYEQLLSNEQASHDHPARYALVELENVHSPAMAFEPIHRIITQTNPALLIKDVQSICCDDGVCVSWISGEETGQLRIAVPDGELTVGVLQDFLDQWLRDHAGKIDYIHDEDAVTAFAKEPASVAFILPTMGKNELFPFVKAGRTLPRKTFSMGHGSEKRYYLEGRKIR